MKLNKNTITALNNFATINPGIVVTAGNVIDTISPSQFIIAKFELDQEFEQDFAIYDLPVFLSQLNFLKNPSMIIEDRRIRLESEDGIQGFVSQCDPSMIMKPTDDMAIDVEYEFDLSKEVFDKIKNLSGTVNTESILFNVEDGKVWIRVKSPGKDSLFEKVIGETDCDLDPEESVAEMPIANMLWLPDDYHVRIDTGGMSHLSNGTGKHNYWIALKVEVD